VALLASLLVAWVGGLSMVWLRRLNAHWARERLAAIDHGSGRAVVGLQLIGMSADLVRGFLLTGLALLVLTPVADLVLGAWGRSDDGARAVAVGLAAMVATAACWKLFHAMKHARILFAAGAAIGVVALVFGA
jgi:PTS system mannose-specific IIC component